MSMKPIVNLDELFTVKPSVDDITAHIGCQDSSQQFLLAATSPDKIIEAALQYDQVHFISSGKWNLYDMLTLLLGSGYEPATLHISTFSISEYAMRVLAGFVHDKRLTALYILLNSGAKIRYPNAYQIAANIATRISLRPVHAKVMVLQSLQGCFTITGSANWTENPKIEQGHITRNEAVASFHTSWLIKAITDGNIYTD